MCKNPLYEQRRNLDRQAGLSADTSAIGKKHKLEEDKDIGTPDKEGKFQPKKPKKDREGDAACKEDKSRLSKEQDRKSLEDKHKHGKKDEKHHDRRRDEEERCGPKEESRYHHSRDESSRHPTARENQDKYKPGKHPEPKCKPDREQDKGRLKGHKDPGRIQAPPETAKPDPPAKSYEPPKIICGPSPAMRAKLRKQNQEACKAAPAAPISTFGKFMWKKKENVLAKEAQKAAVEFLREDEAPLGRVPKRNNEGDPFMKSLAFAKQIAEKLGGVAPPATGRIRPNLSGPSTIEKRTALMGTAASLSPSPFPSTQSTTFPQPPSSRDDPIFAEPAPPKPTRPALLPTPVQPPLLPTPRVAPPTAFPQTPLPFMRPRSDPVFQPKVSRVAVSEAQQAATPAVCPQAAPTKSEPPTLLPQKNCAREPVKAAAAEAKQVKPSPGVTVTIVPDVAAPGVPESEQTQVVFVKPPPVATLGDGARRTEKTKSSLAAAQDLFGIWYSSIGQTSSAGFTKPVFSDATSEASKKQSCPPDTSTPQVHSDAEPQNRSQPPSLDTPPCPEPCDDPPPAPDIQIASVWSLEPDRRTEAEPRSSSPNLQPGPPPREEVNPLASPPSLGPSLTTEPSPPRASQNLQPSPPSQAEATALSQVSPAAPSKTEAESQTSDVSKVSPKSKGRKSSSPLQPLRQTRSQTRYRTRRQQHNQSEPDPESASADSDTGAVDLKEVPEDPGSRSSLKVEEVDEVPAETLNLPSHITSLDFTSDLNFE